MQDSFIPYAKQSIDSSDTSAVSNALLGDMITRGPKVHEFEREIAKFCGAQFAVAFNSGSSALLAACHAAGVNQNDRLISTPNTFVSSVGAGIHFRATPVFIDINRRTGNLDLEKVGYALEKPYSRGRSIIMPVHFSGIPVDMHALERMISDPNAVVIEDAAHAIGSFYPDGTKVGSCTHSQMTIFSFHPAKTITTGEGGMVTTNDETLFHQLQLFRNNGIERSQSHLEGEPAPWYYEVKHLSNNYNFSEMQAALGLSQLARIEQFIDQRRQLVSAYRERVKNIPHITTFSDEFDLTTAFHLFVVQIDFQAYKTTRSEVMDRLKKYGIGTQVHYIPVYRHPYFKKTYGDLSPYFPEMENYYSQALSLPLYYDLNIQDIDRIIHELRSALVK
jgi:UDP-4-amino-4,6-dideoxy-L-N-acetyl-beta-L-altrosamine transaminase